MNYRTAFACGAAAFMLLMAVKSRADECRSIDSALAEVFARADGATLRRNDLTLAQLDFARGIYASAPPAGEYPADGHATLARLPNDDAAIIFHSDRRSCGMIWIPAALTKTLLAFGAREQTP